MNFEDPILARGTNASAAIAREAVLAELDAIRTRRTNLLHEADAELERLAAFLPVTEQAGIRQHEIAARAGVSRQTLVNLRTAGRGRGRAWNIDLRLMISLAFDGPQTVDALETELGPFRDHDVARGLKRLVNAGSVGRAGRWFSGSAPIDYYKLTPQGLEELPERLRHAAMPPSRRWTAYVSTTTMDADKIARAGESVLGQYEVAVVPAGTTHEMKDPEIAFRVEAPNFQRAIAAAGARYRRLRGLAGLDDSAPAQVTALVPPERTTGA